MKATVYSTDEEWFNFLIENKLLDKVDFWTSRNNKLNIQSGSPFFFKIKKNIVGVGNFIKQDRLSVKEAWLEYGPKNGVSSFNEFLSKLSSSFRKELNADSEISLLIISDITKFPRPVPLKTIKKEKMQTMGYIDGNDVNKIFESIELNFKQKNEDSVFNGKLFNESILKIRAFQQRLREKTLEKYGNKCMICGIDIKELLNVSHIKPVNKFPENAVDLNNVLLLCKQHDAMFDKGLISIASSGNILISDYLKRTKSDELKEEIKKLENSKLNYDLASSRDFLEYHYNNIFKK
ncbi:MAG: HNH endonuclease [Minisyncoccia bacterium]